MAPGLSLKAMHSPLRPLSLRDEAFGDDGMLWAATRGQPWPQDHLEPSGSSTRWRGQMDTLQG